MVFLLILTLCGEPHMVMVGDGKDLHYQFWSKLNSRAKELALSVPGHAEVEVWAGSCA